MERRDQSCMSETIISTKKIWANIKAFWWICLVTFLLAAVVVGMSTYRSYQANKAAEGKDSYIGSAVLYLSSENEKDARAYAAVLTSQSTIEVLNQALSDAGMEAYAAGRDSLAIRSQSDSTAFGLTVLAIGEERTKILLDTVIDQVLKTASEVMGVKAELLSAGTVKPCLWYADGSFKTLSDPSQRVVTLSLSDFLTWKKMMILFTGLFLGVAAIFAAVLLDNKIRSQEELRAVTDAPFFGEWNKKDKVARERVLFLIQNHFLNRAGNSVALISAEGNSQLTEAAEELSHGLNIPVHTAAQEAVSVETMKMCAESDGVILAVRADRDRLNQIRVILDSLQVAGIPLLGYMLMKE